MGGLELLSAAFVSHRFAPHAHEEAVIAVVEAGAEAYSCGRGETGVVPAGGVLLIEPGEVHHGRVAPGASGWRYRAFYPPPALLATVWRSRHAESGRGDEAPRLGPRVLADATLARALSGAHQALDPALDVDPLCREVALREALGRLLDHLAGSHDDDVSRLAATGPGRPGAGGVSAGLARARGLIEDAYADDLRVAHLAAAAGLSEGFLIRAFAAAYGLSPHAYLTQVRLRAARRLLQRGEPPACVALAVGFCDQSHLSRQFRRAFGVPPARYARGIAGRAAPG